MTLAPINQSRTGKRERGNAGPAAPASPLPILYHPLVALSAVVTMAAIVQIAASLISRHLPDIQESEPSAIVAHGVLYDVVEQVLSEDESGKTGTGPRMVGFCLGMSFVSGIAWYGAGYLALGARWALWIGLCCVTHPLAAFVLHRPGKLVFLIAAMSILWLAALWWRRRGGVISALLMGVTLGLTSLLSFVGLAYIPIILFWILLRPDRELGRLSTICIVLVALVLSVVPPGMLMLSCLAKQKHLADTLSREKAPTLSRFSESLSNNAAATLTKPAKQVGVSLSIWSEAHDITVGWQDFLERVDTDLWNAFDPPQIRSHAANLPAMGHAAHSRRGSLPTPTWPSSLQFFVQQSRESTEVVASWAIRRIWETVYSTPSGRFHRPLLVLQLMCVLPGVWGCYLALRHPRWREWAIPGIVFLAFLWGITAIAEPLAQNLTPVCGLGITFSMIGWVNIFQRLLGVGSTLVPGPAKR